MTYNIRLDTPADGENAWVHRRAWVSAQIRLLAPDIFGMQEVLLNQKQDLMATLPDYVFIGAGRDDGKDGGESSPIAFRSDRWKLLSSGTFWLSPTPDLPSNGWDAAYPRVVTWTRLTHVESGRKIIAINTHWDHVGEQARLHSAQLIRRWITTHRQKEEFIVLLGDFNSAIDSEAMQTLTNGNKTILLNDAKDLSLTPPFGPVGSFNDFKLLFPQQPAIDHILVSDAITVVSYNIVAQHVEGRLFSDHYPVVADLRLSASDDGKECNGPGNQASSILPGQQVAVPSTNDDYPYLQFVPRTYGADNPHKWPLLIFLHGSGERGADIERVKVHGPPKLVESNPDFPFVTISPLLEADGDWNVDRLDRLLERVSQSLNIDPARIYLTGLSRGAHAVWRWAAARPGRFAAIAPVSGRGNVDAACQLKPLPIWAFHGADDTVVPSTGSSGMVEAINQCGGQARLDIYPDTGHNAWTRAYADSALYDWLLKQRLTESR